MNMLILGVALTGAVFLAPSAKADGIAEPVDLCAGVNSFSPAEMDVPFYAAELSFDNEAYVDAVIAEITSTIDRAPETIDGPYYVDTYGYAFGPDAPAYAGEHWGAALREIPMANWETAVYEIPLTIELAIGASQYGPAGFATDAMAVEFASWDNYERIEPVLMLEVLVRF